MIKTEIKIIRSLKLPSLIKPFISCSEEHEFFDNDCRSRSSDLKVNCNYLITFTVLIVLVFHLLSLFTHIIQYIFFG